MVSVHIPHSIIPFIFTPASTSPRSYFQKTTKIEEKDKEDVSGSPAIYKTIFAKPRHKNRMNKHLQS